MQNCPKTETDACVAVAARHPRLRLLVLIGSRAAGTAHERSDWDFGALADSGLDLAALAADLAAAVGSDDVDVVDLSAASAVLRRDAAVAGRLLVERESGDLAAFQIQAVTYWADVEPVLREAHADVLRAVAG